MMGTGDSVITNRERVASTDVNCDVEGHCLHQATAPELLWCCKCHQYIQKQILAEKLKFYERFL